MLSARHSGRWGPARKVGGQLPLVRIRTCRLPTPAPASWQRHPFSLRGPPQPPEPASSQGWAREAAPPERGGGGRGGDGRAGRWHLRAGPACWEEKLPPEARGPSRRLRGLRGWMGRWLMGGGVQVTEDLARRWGEACSMLARLGHRWVLPLGRPFLGAWCRGAPSASFTKFPGGVSPARLGPQLGACWQRHCGFPRGPLEPWGQA